MEQLQELQTQFGLMTWPLIICSALTVMIIAERLFQVFISLGVGKSAIRQHLASLNQPTAEILKRWPMSCRASVPCFIAV